MLPVYSSHLSLRFYEAHGWTRLILESCLSKGRLVSSREMFGDPLERAYYSRDIHAEWDWDKLSRYVGEVHRHLGCSDESLNMTDLDYMKSIDDSLSL
jgi:hypothetical protein